MNEKQLIRFGISMEQSLLNQFDLLINDKGYNNRSEAVRDLIRDALIQDKWEKDDQEVAGSILIFYDHHQRNLLEKLTEIQHKYHDQILATTHFHLDHQSCLEIIVVKGNAKELRDIKDKLTILKGVKYGKLTVSPIKDI